MQTIILEGVKGSIDIMHFSLVFMKTSFIGLYQTIFKLLTMVSNWGVKEEGINSRAYW
jgi:hypothetical protein